MRKLLFAITLFALTLAPLVARADGLVLGLSPTWTCSPVGMLTGFQYNVKTGDFQKGIGLGAGYGCRYTGWKLPLSIEAVGGMAVNSGSPNAAQGSIIFAVADNYGIGPGTQVFKDPVTGNLTGQMLVSFFLTGSWASTTEQLNKAKTNSWNSGRAAGLTEAAKAGK